MYAAARETRAGSARALFRGGRLFRSVRRDQAARARAASVRLRVSRLRLAYAQASAGLIGHASEEDMS
jgi:hypothetical protein